MNEQQIEKLIRSILSEGVPLDWQVYVILILVSIITTFLAAFLSGYAKKRAENLATKDDFNLLLQQLKETTTETETIKGEIMKTNWVEQKRWDFKRDLYTKILEILEEVRLKTRWIAKSMESRGMYEYPFEAYKNYLNDVQARGLIDNLIKYKAVANMMLTREAVEALDDLEEAYNKFADELVNQDPTWNMIYDISDRTETAYRMVLEAAEADLMIIDNY